MAKKNDTNEGTFAQRPGGEIREETSGSKGAQLVPSGTLKNRQILPGGTQSVCSCEKDAGAPGIQSSRLVHREITHLSINEVIK